jgi:hypothetical protein
VKKLKQVDLLQLERARRSGVGHSSERRPSFLRQHWWELIPVAIVYGVFGYVLGWVASTAILLYLVFISYMIWRDNK